MMNPTAARRSEENAAWRENVRATIMRAVTKNGEVNPNAVKTLCRLSGARETTITFYARGLRSVTDRTLEVWVTAADKMLNPDG